MYSRNRNTFHSQTHRVPFSEIDLLRLRNLVKAFCCLQSSSDERTYAYTVASNRVIHIRNELSKMNSGTWAMQNRVFENPTTLSFFYSMKICSFLKNYKNIQFWVTTDDKQ